LKVKGINVSKENRVGGIDPAALAAATVAAAISTIAPAGPYGPVGMIIGATIFGLILAYDVDPHRTSLQSLAFGAVCGLILLLTFGFPLEILASNTPRAQFNVLFHERKDDILFSEVPPYVALLFWLAVSAIVAVIDGLRARSKRLTTSGTEGITAQSATGQ
jgi:hypothetical protein